MTSPTLLVNLDTDRPNTGLLQVASSLAERLGAEVIGVAARQRVLLDASGTCYIPQDVIDDAAAETDLEMDGAEAEFRAAFHGRGGEWRSSISFGSPTDYIVAQARHADLLLTGIPPHAKADAAVATVGELVLRCGRPVLAIPAEPKTASLDRAMLAWKDTREARRAALDALPLLKRAARVAVVEIAADEDMPAARRHVEDVARWLASHGVVAEPLAVAGQEGDAEQLETAARNFGADMLVAGAYGHSRLREWAFGGVTRALLQQGNRCALLSH